jgi:pyrimidine-nucleoside phosphorylase
MRAVDIIIRKRDKEELRTEEINFFIEGFVSGEITDYQASAWAMAVVLNGMNLRETTDLTLAIARSGATLDLSDVVDIAVDKHSSGGVGDKTTLVVLPVVAACGLPVGKMSGRGLGFSGGTIDKLESIPGYRVTLTTEEFKNQLKQIGVVLTGQSLDLAPADGKLYALRDVTGTVQSIPLIASSIMSKKIAAGANAIVLDVKVGLGAFMQSLDEARLLADTMTRIGEMAGRKVKTLLSDMNQPLGFAVGNALEVREAIDVLQGNGPADFREHCLVACAHMLLLGNRVDSLEAGKKLAEGSIQDGNAWEKFRQLVIAQGGNVDVVDRPDQLPQAKYVAEVKSPRRGYLSQVHARLIGEASVLLGAGRSKKTDPVDHAVGIVVHRKVGDLVEKDGPLFTLYANDEERLGEARALALSAHQWQDQRVAPLPLFYD